MDVSAPAPTPAVAPGAAPGAAERKTARAFEEVFVGQMMQLMMGTVGADPNFGGGHAEEMFRGILAEKMGAAVTERGGLGLAPRVLDEIIRLQGGGR